jgi:hypothetical protein
MKKGHDKLRHGLFFLGLVLTLKKGVTDYLKQKSIN